ncbi:cuticle protein 7-like [Macrobrachium rosenbergii]|uniref:cuticle protein 7-like n=1 Tax=Macrobrachium rosenbergii TaxID=79674 RepID=UPI0034D6ACE1
MFSQVCILAVFAAVCKGAVPPYPRYPSYPPPSYHKPPPYHPPPAPYHHPEPNYDVPPKYEYAYDVNDDYQKLKFDKQESRDGYKTEGQYTVDLPDGRKQIVTYTDNGDGLYAEVKYEGDIVLRPYGPPSYPAPHPPPSYPREPYFPAYQPLQFTQGIRLTQPLQLKKNLWQKLKLMPWLRTVPLFRRLLP